MKNCSIQKLHGFKGGKIWHLSFFCVSRRFDFRRIAQSRSVKRRDEKLQTTRVFKHLLEERNEIQRISHWFLNFAEEIEFSLSGRSVPRCGGIAFSARCNHRQLPVGIFSSQWTKMEWQPRGNKPPLSQIADHSREIHDNLFYSARWRNRAHCLHPARLSCLDELFVSVLSVSIRFSSVHRAVSRTVCLAVDCLSQSSRFLWTI